MRLFGFRLPARPFAAADGIVSDARLRSDERFLQHLAFGFPLDHARARDAARLLKARKEDWARANPPGEGGDEDALILRLLTAAVQRTVSGTAAGRPIAMGVSSGYDSRAILLALRRLGIAPATYTFGQTGSFDFDFAGDLSGRLGLDHAEIDTSKCGWALETFDRYVSTAAQDVVISPRTVAEKFMDEKLPDRVDLHGYFNGCVTGSLFSDGPATDWNDAVAEFCRKNDVFGYQQHLGVDCSAFMPAEPLAPEEDFPFGHQLALAYRQIQRIRPVPPGHSTAYAFPMEDRDWMGFWLNRKPEELAGQRRYIRFLRNLRSPEFHDLDGIGDDRHRQARLRQFYGQAGPAPGEQRMVKPRKPRDHFCVFACFANNARFREMVGQSLARLRKRNVIKKAFIDKVRQRFADGEQPAGQMLKGLVTTDLVLEAGRFA